MKGIMADVSLQKLLKHDSISTLIAAVCCALLLMGHGLGHMIYLVAILWLPWAVFTLIRAIRNPAQRKSHLIRIGIWVVALAVAISAHALYSYRARHHADEIVMKIKGWRSTHGEYPCSAEESATIQEEARNQLVRYSSYSCPEKSAYPRFWYADTFWLLARWHYDFERDVWVFSG